MAESESCVSILIVDDTPDNLLLLKSILKHADYSDLLFAKSAQEAFNHLSLSDSPEKGSGVDLILMDFMMPEISGVEACRKIKGEERLKDIPIIMVTARDDIDSLDAAFAAGALDYITKPVRKGEILVRVRSALRLKREIDERKQNQQQLQLKNETLEKALQEIKVLRGFLPICCICKKIRDDEGYWQQMEAYLQDHSEVQFSHGICSTCMTEHYSPEKKTDTIV